MTGPTTELISDGTFRLMLSLATGVVGGLWVIHDILFFVRVRNADHRDPRIHDQRFGYAIGVIIGMIGVIGTLRFNGVL